MKAKHASLQIRIDMVDGSTQAFQQTDPEQINGTLTELHPAQLFNHDRITISDDGTELELVPPLITRIDLVTEHLSVWDFPFVLGAPVELTEAEFLYSVHNLVNVNPASTQTGFPVYFDLEMVNGQRIFLWMQVAAGLPASHLERVYSLLKEHRLIFGLRAGGIGILNLSNLVRFEVHPEPPRPNITASARYALHHQKNIQTATTFIPTEDPKKSYSPRSSGESRLTPDLNKTE